MLIGGEGVPELIVDNLELSDSIQGGPPAPILYFGACGSGDTSKTWNALFRNIYLHDTGQGIFKNTAQCPVNATMLNSRIARTGGAGGPSHGIYISNVMQTGNPTPVNFTIKRSVFEENFYGHLVKTHATTSTYDCDVFIKDWSEGYGGTASMQFSQNGGVATVTNSLILNGPYKWDNYKSNPIGVQWSADWTGGYYPYPTMSFVANNNIWINDTSAVTLGGILPVFFGQYGHMAPSGNLPYAQHNNTFIGGNGAWAITDTNGGLNGYYAPMPVPYVSWCINKASGSCGDPALFPANDVTNNMETNLGCGAPPAFPLPYTSGNQVNYACAQDQPANSLGNVFYSSRATAGIGAAPDVASGAIVGWPLDRTKFPIPAACMQPIGNVAAPRS